MPALGVNFLKIFELYNMDIFEIITTFLKENSKVFIELNNKTLSLRNRVNIDHTRCILGVFQKTLPRHAWDPGPGPEIPGFRYPGPGPVPKFWSRDIPGPYLVPARDSGFFKSTEGKFNRKLLKVKTFRIGYHENY